MILGITGGTGCGKTTLLEAVGRAGGLVLDCDRIYHELLTRDNVLTDAIEARFPGTVSNNALDRKKLGGIVFSDPRALLDLNRITHAAVKQEVQRRLAHGPALAAIDAVGLFEGGLAELCHVTVAVTAPREDQIRRLMVRDGISREYARSRIDAQHDEGWFRQRCDHVLENSGDLDAFATKCVDFLASLDIMKETP